MASQPRKLFQLTRREFLRLGLFAGASGILGAAGSAAYGFGLEPGWIDVSRLTLALPRLPAVFEGLRLAHLTDLHLDDWMTDDRLASIVDLTNREAPDAVLLTGDYITGIRDIATRLPALTEQLARLNPPLGVFAVLGNHDHWTDARAVRGALESAGVLELRNRAHRLGRAGQALYVCGVDDYWERYADLDRVMGGLPDAACAILLSHEPDFADISAATGRFDLQLSGHSHGGQVALPFVGPLILPTYAEKYPSGLYQVGRMWQYTSRGLGMVEPRVRFNCRPELALLTLTHS
ncbi:MAG: metallophosphoesterase [Anaerolineae bacterium]|nr:MAG: metallophosphoesterase [Anaerolineae bacterium]